MELCDYMTHVSNVKCVRYDVIGLCDRSESGILAGARSGKALLSKLIEETLVQASGRVCFLDFQRADVATASFLRESAIAFRDYCRGVGSDLYPVVANPNAAVEEELHDLLIARGDAMIACELGQDSKAAKPRIIGLLEAKQRETFELLKEVGSATASALACRDLQIGTSAWSNRLSALVSRGLAIEERDGRQKRFRPILEGIRSGY